MTGDRARTTPEAVFGALLLPLRLPGRVVADIETLTGAVLSLQRTAEKYLASIDRRAGALLREIGALQVATERIEGRVEELTGLEATIEDRMEVLRGDLNTRMLALEAEVHGMRPPIDAIARDVQDVVRLLPDASDGPLARLRDTFTSS
ncbi:MAG TPA: hypothetical protein VFR49_06845 [Solirubrobacteraceae bacterium]|nr:hypothetical protein [Solirubrobacteraceae bacterium]